MSTAASRMTAIQLAAMPDEGMRYELIHGELRMMSPAGGQHGRIAMRIGRLLANHVEEHDLGEVFAAETGFLLSRDPDTVRAPDAAFVNAAAIQQITDLVGYVSIAPDLVVEVVSPNDSSTDVESKAQMWIGFGTRLVLVVDPVVQSVRVYRERSSIEVYFIDDIVDVSDVVDLWKLTVADIF